jgi:predicted ATPase
MIKSIKLENFKCYKDQVFNFLNLTVFCGNNSVGKSTAIQALGLPFQSKFDHFCSLNGPLTNLGNFRDIFSTFSEKKDADERLNIEITFLIKGEVGTISMGYQNFDSQEPIGNKLKLEFENITSDQLCNWYFKENGFQFLEAERFGPRNNFNLNEDNEISNWVGARGEYTIEILNNLINKSTGKSRNSFPKGEVRDLRMLSENHSISHNINAWMSEISPGFSITATVIESAGISHATFKTNTSISETKPINMGFGLSYALGIVTALMITKPNGLVVIENPEAHLHPRGQSYLGRLIALTALAGVQVIVETHSDHLLNGIRVISRLRSEYQDGMFKVYYISAGDQQSHATEINIGTKGELSSWPAGFFDQQAFDVKTLMKGEDTQGIQK